MGEQVFGVCFLKKFRINGKIWELFWLLFRDIFVQFRICFFFIKFRIRGEFFNLLTLHFISACLIIWFYAIIPGVLSV